MAPVHLGKVIFLLSLLSASMHHYIWLTVATLHSLGLIPKVKYSLGVLFGYKWE